MLFQITYTARSGGSVAENEASGKRGLAMLSKWSPPAGLEISRSTLASDGRGGTLVVETNDVPRYWPMDQLSSAS